MRLWALFFEQLLNLKNSCENPSVAGSSRSLLEAKEGGEDLSI